jgi:hypothetical protein
VGIMIITNNEKVYDKYKEKTNIIFVQGGFKDVLIKTRDKIHEGHELLTHPLSSSVKPNETPFKSVMISDEKRSLNLDSLYIIENSIMTYDNFSKHKFGMMTEQITEDFKLIDLTVLESALNI